MDRLTKEEIVFQLLHKYFPFETELIGNEAVQAITKGASPEMPQAGESFDATSVFEILVSATTILSNIILIYAALRDKKKEKPTLAEYKNEINLLVFSQELHSYREEITQYVYQKLDNEK